MTLILGFGVALVLGYAVNRFLVIPGLQRHAVLDHPTARSSHDTPVVRGGGIGVIAGTWLAALLLLLCIRCSTNRSGTDG